MGVRRTDCKDYRSSTTYDLKYLDDNNCEDEVPEDEIRRVLDERKRENLIRLSTAKHEGDASGGVDDGSEGGLPTKAEDKTTGGDVWVRLKYVSGSMHFQAAPKIACRYFVSGLIKAKIPAI